MKYLLLLIIITNSYAWDSIIIMPNEKKVNIDGKALIIDVFPSTLDCVAIKSNKEDGTIVEYKNGQDKKKDFDLSPYIKAWNDQKQKNDNPPPIIQEEEPKSIIMSIILDTKVKLVAITQELNDDPTNQDLKDEKQRLQSVYDSYKKKLKK